MAKGKKTGGGSRKGKPNKGTQELREMILGALDKSGGVAYLQRQADQNPASFLTLIGKCLPTKVQGDADHPLKVQVNIGFGCDDG